MTNPPARTSQTPLIAGIIGAAFAAIGVFSMPYAYYSTMRVVVAAVCVTMGFGAIVRHRSILVAPLAFAAILFLFVKGFSKETWAVIDLFTAVGLVAIGAWLARQEVHE